MSSENADVEVINSNDDTVEEEVKKDGKRKKNKKTGKKKKSKSEAEAAESAEAGAELTDEAIHELFEDVRKAHRECDCGTRDWRERQLRGISALVSDNEEAIAAALKADLGKCQYEAKFSEMVMVRSEAEEALSQLKSWMSSSSVSTPLVHLKGLTGCAVQPQPLGVVLIIGAWNFPFVLALSPLVGAVAAGNAVVLKPSEVAPHVSRLLADLVPKYLDPRAVRVVEGAVRETTALLREPWDHILYTGNGTVGRIVMRAAAEHLTPITLELGGKSPCLVDEDTNVAMAARRIAWGKWTNAGQICIAPDYVLVHEKVQKPFMEALRQQITEFYGERPQESESYGRIINERHVERLRALLQSAEDCVRVGGEIDKDDRYIAPTVLENVPWDAAIMRDEIFGPLLPVQTVESMEEAVEIVRKRPKPLALYCFSKSTRTHKLVKIQTTSGQLVFNDTLVQFTIPGLPFGGVGESGMGAYHGKHSFDRFSHHRSVVDKSAVGFLDLDVRYPPYTHGKLKMLSYVL